ncbi:hypothetical protein J2X55_002235 [Microbacterium sp. 1154]|uniref:hypothetical protein n=1 Tax=Microbacterium sp. 1154 TaxID=2817733 RepID=UPI002861BD2F|nr:hypothetical protein [Microbacterium sp. 1154]MDR6691323.1 hypothetical protein [Microbacterium sp. 1154]
MDHALEELIPDEDVDGLFVVWVCECGKRGRAATQQTAHTGWRRHAERGENVWCGGVV